MWTDITVTPVQINSPEQLVTDFEEETFRAGTDVEARNTECVGRTLVQVLSGLVWMDGHGLEWPAA